MVVEGHATAKSARALAKKHGIDMPITEAVCRMLEEDVPAAEAMRSLLSREARSEQE